MNTIKWRALLGLSLIVIAGIFELLWLWGLVLIAWTIPDIRSGQTHLFEMVTRSQNPVTFWLIMITWVCSGLGLIYYSHIIGYMP